MKLISGVLRSTAEVSMELMEYDRDVRADMSPLSRVIR